MRLSTSFAAVVLAIGVGVTSMPECQTICFGADVGDASGTSSVLPRPDFRFTGDVGRTYLDSDKPQFPQPVKAPKGAPNILLVLLDDAGFGQFSTFGGGIPSPTMDRLAADGLRYNRFHTTALCSPTRAALITGRNHHSNGFASITETATGYDGYTCVLPKACGTVAEVLKQNGYSTAWIGKNHNTPPWDTSQAGPFDRWANGLGFEYFYGFNAGDMNHWNPILYENRNLVPASTDPNYHLTEDLANRSIAWVRQMKSIAPDKPFFLYVAPGATHAPHHAPKDWIEKFKGKFDGGWDAYREETLARQKKLGVVPENTMLTERSHGLPAWDSLNADQKRLYARMMEVFCAYGAHVDHRMGRVIDAVKQLPDADNTIIIYIAGDNGSSAEGGIEGSLCENMFFNGFPTCTGRLQYCCKKAASLSGCSSWRAVSDCAGALAVIVVPFELTYRDANMRLARGQALVGRAVSATGADLELEADHLYHLPVSRWAVDEHPQRGDLQEIGATYTARAEKPQQQACSHYSNGTSPQPGTKSFRCPL
ncbi:sulfatase-like hydrolase/transferase [Lacipirellula parvula]|uniref:Arylsulfatase n=1 Tax=Lacipirellula parvula TaxID=2650471 RepID=A0A5K7XFD1_9BACT|nr:sulfatase-like hydrolase/transferase [Lacipirellula parvula]BBO35218.1 arylsulfatase [Lacipirellula parvula]